jgi:predicted SprT family Zn-dependent metalloprotease
MNEKTKEVVNETLSHKTPHAWLHMEKGDVTPKGAKAET